MKQGNRNEEEVSLGETHKESKEQEGDLPIPTTQDTGGNVVSTPSIFSLAHISFQIALYHRSHHQSSKLFHS